MKRETPTPERVAGLLFGGAGWKGWQPDFPDWNAARQLSEMGFEEADAAWKTLLRMNTDFLMASRLARLVEETAEGLRYARGDRDFPNLFFQLDAADFKELLDALPVMLDKLDKTAKTETARQMGARLRRILESVRGRAGDPLEERERAAKDAAREAREVEDAATRGLLQCRTFAGWIEGARIANGTAATRQAEALAEAHSRQSKEFRKFQDGRRAIILTQIALDRADGLPLDKIAERSGLSKGEISKQLRTPEAQRATVIFSKVLCRKPPKMKRGRPIGSRKHTHGGAQGADEMDRQQAQKWRDDWGDAPAKPQGGEE